MKNLIIFCLGMLFLYSCDPPVDCTDPKCADSPLLTKVKADLSDTSMTLRVGDTLKMKLRIPDTIVTNQSQLFLASMQRGFLSFHFFRIDTIVSKSEAKGTSEAYIVKKGSNANFSSVIELEKSSKEAEVHFVLSKKGKYIIQIGSQSQRLELTTKDGKQFLVMMNVGFNVKSEHHDLYLSWMGDPNSRIEQKAYFQDRINQGLGYYAFKVE